MSLEVSCIWLGLLVILIGSIGNWLCICVFCRKRFRSSMLTPFFIALLIADCIYLTVRVIKLLYYQQTLFHNFFHTTSCSSSSLVRIYGYLTQNAPQFFVPLCHYEFYIRFSLLLMAFLAVQRAYDMCHSSYRIISRNSSTRSSPYVLIICAFSLSYFFELFGLSLFCSAELSLTIAYQWYETLRTNLSNQTIHLITFIKNQSNDQHAIDCITKNVGCLHEERVQMIRQYFDMHERPIVYLIHKIQLSTIGYRMARNELRVKYHYHTCPIRFQANFFLQIYDLLYSRKVGFNRYTIILVAGSIIPSIVTIFGNALSLGYIIKIRSSVNEQSRASRRRTDETRRVVIILTTECLLAVISSWFVDIILSVKYCNGAVAIGDDCPDFLQRYQALLVLCDLVNSMSNIVLYCFAGRRFRQELQRMLHAWSHTIRKCFACHCRVEWRQGNDFERQVAEEQYLAQSDSSTKSSKIVKHSNERSRKPIKLRVTSFPTTVL